MKTIGIDLGTTNSAVAHYTTQGPRIIVGVDGHLNVPSVVSVDVEGNVDVGRVAKRQLSKNPEYTFLNVKRVLGKPYDENETISFQHTEGPDGLIWWVGPDRDYSSPELLSNIIAHLVSNAETVVGEKIARAVITHPEGFREPQLNAIRAAAKLAGVDMLELLSEPIAAVRSFGISPDKAQINVIYDWGGGTFDVTVVLSKNGEFKTIGRSSRSEVGGADIDELIASAAFDDFADREGVDLRSKEYLSVPVKASSEEVKMDLSERQESSVYIQNISSSEEGLLSLNYPVTRDALEKMSQHLVDSTLEATKEALLEAKINKGEVHNIILVGGMTKMPLVHKSIERFFGKRSMSGTEPDQAVALGAALYAAELDGVINKSIIQTICASTIGIEHSNGNFVPFITKGQKLPANVKKVVTGIDPTHTRLDINVFQGEQHLAALNDHVCSHSENGLDENPSIPIEIDINEKSNILVKVNKTTVYESGAE